MPNHFLTIGLCARDYKALEAKGVEDHDQIDFKPLESTNLCELIAPLPEELEGIVASYPKCRYRNKATGEWSKGCNSPMDELDQWERVPLTENEVDELTAKHGGADWFDWQSKHWGTKWGTYDLKVHQIDTDGSPVLIEFQTAWGPPTPEMMRLIDAYLCDTYCLKDIKWIGHQPFDNSTVDIEVAAATEVIA